MRRIRWLLDREVADLLKKFNIIKLDGAVSRRTTICQSRLPVAVDLRNRKSKIYLFLYLYRSKDVFVKMLIFPVISNKV